MSFVCLVRVRLLLSSVHGGFVPRGWLAAKDLFLLRRRAAINIWSCYHYYLLFSAVLVLAGCKLGRTIFLFIHQSPDIAWCPPGCHLVCVVVEPFVFPGNTEECPASV